MRKIKREIRVEEKRENWREGKLGAIRENNKEQEGREIKIKKGGKEGK